MKIEKSKLVIKAVNKSGITVYGLQISYTLCITDFRRFHFSSSKGPYFNNPDTSAPIFEMTDPVDNKLSRVSLGMEL